MKTIKVLFITLLISSLFISSYSYSQEILKGQIINQETSEKIPYTNIAIIAKGIGTISDKEGYFFLEINEKVNEDEKVIISCVGFKTKILLRRELHNNISIELEPQTTFLKEVAISSKNKKKKLPKPKTLGKAHKLLAFFHNYYHIYGEEAPDNLGRERGMIFSLKNDCDINSLNFHISSNDFKKVKLRLLFYKIENGIPTTILNKEDIIFEVNDQYKGWYKLDLKPYKIHFQNNTENIGVTLQWVDSENMNDDSRFFSFSAAILSSPSHLSRNEIMGEWVISKYKLNFYLEYTEKQS